ncbi:hypothetical protein L6452_39667 [Arctium lappa]|uniref:Uncharacterized protein n=1 Tax=Arctium lappa TaxID=4217 RepID=A0ACB8XT62_ARCLA|nr:hypothetical protein L6452_39667 [Arctium lappa]
MDFGCLKYTPSRFRFLCFVHSRVYSQHPEINVHISIFLFDHRLRCSLFGFVLGDRSDIGSEAVCSLCWRGQTGVIEGMFGVDEEADSMRMICWSCFRCVFCCCWG